MRSTRSTDVFAGLPAGGTLGGLYATPSVAKGRVLVGSTNARVYAFASSTGKLLWSMRTGSYVYSPAALSGGTAYIGSYDHRLYALSQTTGRIRWTFNAAGAISGAPTVLDGLVYFFDLRFVLELPSRTLERGGPSPSTLAPVDSSGGFQTASTAR